MCCAYCGERLTEPLPPWPPYIRVGWGADWFRGNCGHAHVHQRCRAKIERRRAKERPMSWQARPAFRLARWRDGWDPRVGNYPGRALSLVREIREAARAERPPNRADLRRIDRLIVELERRALSAASPTISTRAAAPAFDPERIRAPILDGASSRHRRILEAILTAPHAYRVLGFAPGRHASFPRPGARSRKAPPLHSRPGAAYRRERADR
jgi:hypothetical protein